MAVLCRVAVEREDYDMAKALKQDIDKLRAAGEAAATGHIAELPKPRRATDPEEIFNRVLGRLACCHPSQAGPWEAVALSCVLCGMLHFALCVDAWICWHDLPV